MDEEKGADGASRARSMKPILEQKAPRLLPDRSNAIKEWKPAEHHLTHDGQVEFMKRMKDRIAAADKARVTASNVKPIREKKV
jgi:hypothetical protein